jgi:hypothetical protein
MPVNLPVVAGMFREVQYFNPQGHRNAQRYRRRVAVELPAEDDGDRIPATGAGGSSRAKQGSR